MRWIGDNVRFAFLACSEKAASNDDTDDDYSTDSDFHTVDTDALVNSVLLQPSRYHHGQAVIMPYNDTSYACRTSSSASLPRLATIHVGFPGKGTAKRSQRSR